MTPHVPGWRLTLGFAALAAISLAATACGAGPGAQDQATTASSPPVEVFFPKRREVNFGYDELQSGELVRDAAGCLRVRYKGGNVVPLWPPDLEPSVKGDEVRVLDGEGRVVARVGAKISMGGGGIREDALTGEILDQRTKRELLERCPGAYYLVQEGTVRIPQQG